MKKPLALFTVSVCGKLMCFRAKFGGGLVLFFFFRVGIFSIGFGGRGGGGRGGGFTLGP